MKLFQFSVLLLGLSFAAIRSAQGFCGFYVARADAKLFNKASQVVLARDGDRTIVTMASDYEGDPKEFAIVIPVPTVLKKEQVHIGEKSTVDHIDAWTSPRLVEYHDPNPCPEPEREFAQRYKADMAPISPMPMMEKKAAARGVQILEQYTVGEYDILILSAQES